jgi:DNA primase
MSFLLYKGFTMADNIEDIKTRLSIVDVVSQYVQLKKLGRNYKGLCPFHSEKTPSFVVSEEKQICHCFGCNKGGDIFTFIQEVEGVDFPEALSILADRAGVKIVNDFKNAGKSNKSEKDEYYKAHELACDFFVDKLFSTNDGKKTLEYLTKRGLEESTIKQFKIGFAPDEFDALYPYLLGKGISKKVLINCGFVSAKNITSEKIYDKFKNRLMFPVFDSIGRVCGFGGRALSDTQMPKYLNSPDSIIYNKSNLLYGFYHSKQSIKEEDCAVLVEGYFDFLLPYQSGVKNLCAVCGTALTEKQIVMLKRITKNVVTCFDNDDAGFQATKRAYQLLNQSEFFVKTISLDSSCKDPADLVNAKEKGAFKNAVLNAEDFVSFYIKKIIENCDIEKIEGRRKVMMDVLPLYKKMSGTNRDYYVRELSKFLNLKENIIYDEIANFSLPKDHPANNSNEKNFEVGVKMDLEEIIISIILNRPKVFENVKDVLEKFNFSGIAKDVYNALVNHYNEPRNEFDGWNFDSDVFSVLREKIDILLLYADDKYCDLSDQALVNEVEKLIDTCLKKRRSGSLTAIREKVLEAEKNGNKELLVELLKEQQEVLTKKDF